MEKIYLILSNASAELNRYNIHSIIILLVCCTVLLTVIIGCSKSSEGESSVISEDKTNEHAHKEREENIIFLSDEQIRFMDIKTYKLELQNISGYIRVNGEVMINPDQESKAGSLIPGRIKKIYVGEGSYVKAGQTLAVIENQDLINMQVDFINAKNDFDFTKREYERQLKLSSNNVGSKKSLEETESNYKKAFANYKTLQEKLALYNISEDLFKNIYTDSSISLQKYYTVSAPISGNLIKRNVSLGQYIEPSMDLFHIINTSIVFVDLNVFEQDLVYVSEGQKVTLDVSVFPNEIYEGTVAFVNKFFDDNKRTVRVRVLINNKREKLLPNMFVSAKIYVKQDFVLAVPVNAIESEGEEKFVFVKTENDFDYMKHEEKELEHIKEIPEDGKMKNEIETAKSHIAFRKIRVNTGISDDKYIMINPQEELKEGDEIVYKGTFYLKSELKKGELGEEHVH